MNSFPKNDFVKNSIALNESFLLRKNEKDQWFILKDKRIAYFEGICEHENMVSIKARLLVHQDDFYQTPIRSSLLNIYESDGNLSPEVSFFTLKDILAKMFKVVAGKTFVFVPLIHTYLE